MSTTQLFQEVVLFAKADGKSYEKELSSYRYFKIAYDGKKPFTLYAHTMAGPWLSSMPTPENINEVVRRWEAVKRDCYCARLDYFYEDDDQCGNCWALDEMKKDDEDSGEDKYYFTDLD